MYDVLLLGAILTVVAGDVGGFFVVLLMVVVELYLLDDLVEKVVEKLMCVLVHDATEEFISIAKLVDEGTWCNGALIRRIPGDVHIEGAESGEEGGGR